MDKQLLEQEAGRSANENGYENSVIGKHYYEHGYIAGATSSSTVKELERHLNDYKEECDRLEKVAKFWQEKYQSENPQWQPPKLDNL